MGNITELLDEFVITALLPNTVIYSIVLFVGILGNVTVFFVYLTKMSRKIIKPRYFVPILSFFDILVCAVSFTFFTVQTYVLMTFRSDILCKFLVFLVVFTTLSSNSFLLAIAIQRYTMICRPFNKQMTLKWRRITVCFIVISGLIFAFPSLFVAGVAEFELDYRGINISGPSCYVGNNHFPQLQIVHNGFLTFVTTANIIVTVAMYAPIANLIIRRNKHKLSSRTGGQESRSEFSTSRSQNQDFPESSSTTHKKIKVNFNMMFLMIILVYVITNISTAAINISKSFTEDFWKKLSSLPEKYCLIDFLSKLYVFNHVANPFIYAYFDIEFQHCFKKFRKCSGS